MTVHRCRYPLWHRLCIILVGVLWVSLGACWLLPHSLSLLTSSAVWALCSIGLGLVPGTMIVLALATWRCRPRCAVGKGPSLVMPFAVLAWVLRHH